MASTEERISRITTGQLSTISDAITRPMIWALLLPVPDPLNVVRMTIAPSTNGRPKKMSAIRESSASTQPPR